MPKKKLPLKDRNIAIPAGLVSGGRIFYRFNRLPVAYMAILTLVELSLPYARPGVRYNP